MISPKKLVFLQVANHPSEIRPFLTFKTKCFCVSLAIIATTPNTYNMMATNALFGLVLLRPVMVKKALVQYVPRQLPMIAALRTVCFSHQKLSGRTKCWGRKESVREEYVGKTRIPKEEQGPSNTTVDRTTHAAQ
jgi:hypothetical protein